MADKSIVTNETISTVDTITTLYTSPEDGGGTLITAFTATNCITTGVSYLAYIVAAGDSTDCPIIPFTIVGRDRFHSGPSIVNQTIPAGGTLRIENSATNGLNFYATGREQS